ncbi:MAG: hypothetical protein FWG08_00060 [Propionibacteriaceae bacterium]|nr:hypothetical protein [Propionibacteriaceae bacterium]
MDRQAGDPHRRSTTEPETGWEENERAKHQVELGILDFGEKLTQREIEFVDRLLSYHGEKSPEEVIQWVPRISINPDGTLKPSNDFVWHANDGHEYELKCPKYPSYKGIRRRLRDDLAKGKNRFFIDLGDHHFDFELRRSLTRYKSQRSIVSLFVLSDNGTTLTEV